MSAPVTTVSTSPAAAALTGGASAASPAVSLTPLGSPLFSNMLSMGLSSLTMEPTAPSETQNVTVTAANSDIKNPLAGNNGFTLQKALLITPDELNAASQEDLKSLLANFGDTTDELSPKILVSLAPGVPAKDALENIKAKLTELGIDTSKFTSIAMTTPTTENATAITNTAALVADSALTVNAEDATKSVNFLLITTGFTPSEMGPLKDAIKSASTKLSGELSTDTSDTLDTSLTDNSTEMNASAAMVLMVFVTPPPQPTTPPTAQDISLDLSALSAFTQTAGSDIEEPDWTKKLSDKLSTMSLDKDVSPFDTDTASPFDDEMNAILSLDTATASKSADTGFKGSIAATKDTSVDADKPKTMSAEISAQALQALNHGGALASAALHNLNSDNALLAVNGNILNAQNMSSLSNPIFTSGSAIGTHPSVQAVAALIEKSASGSEKAKQELSVQLDPPELGRMQVHLSMEKDGRMKVHLLAEKEETLSLFQRDAHALKSALGDAGIQVDSGSLTFDLANGDQSFSQLMGGSQDNQSKSGESRKVMGISGGAIDTANMTTIDTKMDFVANAITGNVHYSFLA